MTTKAFILAGGYGKRLRPLTDDKPKPLIEIAGKPILEWQIQWLKSFGIKDFYILAGYKKDVLIDWVSKNQDRLGVNIAVISEEEPSGTGGALNKAKNFMRDDEFIVTNGDVITNLDITKLVNVNSLVAIALVPLRSPYGVVQIDDKGKITSFVEKPILKEYWINAGVYKMKPGVIEFLPSKGDIEKTTFPLLAQRGMLRGIKFDNVYWRSIDTIKDIEEATQELAQKSE